MSTDHPALFPSDEHTAKKSGTFWNPGAMAAIIGLIVFLSGSTLQSRLLNGRVKNPLMLLLAANATSGLLAGLLALKLINSSIDNRNEIRQRLEMVAEMNHHIRNALQVIELSAHSTQNENAIASITEAVNRIERVLRELAGTERRKGPRPEPRPVPGDRRAAS
jgi:predicted PurR-regulated permease PerM